jgi:archaellum component FlaF (FlaF/FlaG flagellin family)
MDGRLSAHHLRLAAVVIAVGVALSMAAPATAGGASTSRVSVSGSGGQGNESSGSAAISADGRYVVFLSDASNLVPGDTNGFGDVFVRDLRTARITRVSRSSTGVQGNGPASFPAISADGRYVTYTSTASNLVPHDTNASGDVFVHDRRTGTVVRGSLSGSGAQGDNWSASSRISANGRYITFQSGASNLVPADTNDGWDQFVRDLWAGTTTRVTLSDTGGQIPSGSGGGAISGDGRFVTWFSDAPNVVRGDTDAMIDVFIRDWRAGTTERVSQTYTGTPPDSSSLVSAISQNGRYVAFSSTASNLVPADTNHAGDVFVRDRWTGTTRLESLSSAGVQTNGPSEDLAISADGRYVGFQSAASNLVPADTNEADDVFLRDRRTGTTERISVSTAGLQSDGFSNGITISGDGRRAAFSSSASTLVPRDTNGYSDVFVHTGVR